jgi:hypothetical protein
LCKGCWRESDCQRQNGCHQCAHVKLLVVECNQKLYPLNAEFIYYLITLETIFMRRCCNNCFPAQVTWARCLCLGFVLSRGRTILVDLGSGEFFTGLRHPHQTIQHL